MLMQLIIKKIYVVFFLLFFTHISFANEIFVSLKKNIKYWTKFKWIHSNSRSIKFKFQKSKN